MKKLCIVAPFCSLPDEPYFNRFLYLAEELSSDYDVTLVTSNFRHFDKRFRQNKLNSNLNFEIVLLEESGYKKNVSFSRLVSHETFFKSFKKWFKSAGSEFSLFYSAYPLLCTNKFLIKGRPNFNYKVIVDIQDTWPESISAAFPFISKLPLSFLPFTAKANYIYKNADAIITVSKTYARRVSEVRAVNAPIPVYIGSDFKILKEVTAVSLEPGITHLIYIGTLSHSYDLETVIKAVSERSDYTLHILGGGPNECYLKSISKSNIKFYGFMKYDEMIGYLKAADLVVNPIHSYSKGSVTNKISDYLSLGKPVLNSQLNLEVMELLNEVEHENYISGNMESFNSALDSLKNAKSVCSDLLEKKFDRRVSYIKITDKIDELI